METDNIIFRLIYYILSWYVDIRFVNFILKSKREPFVRPWIIYMIAGTFNWLISYYCTDSLMITMSAFISILVLVVVIYDGNIFSKLVVSLIVLTSGVVVENIVWRVFAGMDAAQSAAGNLSSNLIRLIIIFTLERYIKTNKQTRLPIGSFLNMMIISIGGVVLVNLLMQANLENQFAMAGMCIVAIINICTYHLYVKINEACSQEIEQITMQQQIIMYRHQFDLIEQSEEKIRLLRHDLKKHMLMLTQYMQKGNFEEAQIYAGQIAQNAKVFGEYVKTGNSGIDCIVNHMLARADQLQCKRNIVIQVPETCFMPDFDLNMLLGNLLENALEAVEKAENKNLDLYISYMKGVLYVSLYNTYNGLIRKKGGEHITTKNNHCGHGLGMKSVQIIVKKYHGEMKVQNTKELFKVDIVIYIDAV